MLDHIVWGLELAKVILVFIRELLAESFDVLQEELLRTIRAESVYAFSTSAMALIACDLRGLI